MRLQKSLISRSISLAVFTGLVVTPAYAEIIQINDNSQSVITTPIGNNTINIENGAIVDELYTSNGDNFISVTGGQVGVINSQYQTNGSNRYQLTGGVVSFVKGTDGNDTIILDGSSMPGEGGVSGTGQIFGNAGNNIIIVKSGNAVDVIGGTGDDKIDIWGGSVSGVVMGGTGNDVITLHGNDSKINSFSGDFMQDPGGTDNHDELYTDTLILSSVTDEISFNPLEQRGETFESIDLNDETNITLSNDLWTGSELSTPSIWIDSTSTLNVVNSQTINGDIRNSGFLNLSNGSANNTLHITGDYVGNNGFLNFSTKLSGDESKTDKLEIDGNTSGNTSVVVSNAGGSGAQTINGIELISVGGISDGKFIQKGRIVAGAYDYALVKTGKNWYLSSTDTTPVPVPEPTPDPTPNPVPDPTPDPVPDPTPDPTPEPSSMVDNNVRPEAAAYGVNVAAANTLFSTTLHDRLGETNYVDAVTGEQRVTSLWMRNEGGHNRSTDSSGQNKTQANRYVLQLGGDVAQWTTNGANRFHIGIMGGYANQDAKTRNNHTGYSAKSNIDGYSAGLYGSWFQNNETKTGAYIDTWMLYNWFDNSINGQDNPEESYKSKGITASIETGYTWKLADLSQRSAWFVQPQAQVTYMGVKADDHRESNGTYVTSEGDGNIQSRLGVRTYLKGHSQLDDNKDRKFEPFLEANWIHNTKAFGASLDGVSINQAGARNVGELKAGVEAKLNKSLNLWASIGQQIGNNGYSDTQGIIGLKMNF